VLLKALLNPKRKGNVLKVLSCRGVEPFFIEVENLMNTFIKWLFEEDKLLTNLASLAQGKRMKQLTNDS